MTEMRVPPNVEGTTSAVHEVGIAEDFFAANLIRMNYEKWDLWVQFSDPDSDGNKRVEVWAYNANIPHSFCRVAKQGERFCSSPEPLTGKQWEALCEMAKEHEQAMTATAA